MPASTNVKTKFDKGSVILEDGSGPALTHSIQFDNGDWEVSGLLPGGRAIIVPEARGHRTGPARLGARAYPSFKLTGKLAALTDLGVGPTDGTLQDFLHAKAGTRFATRKTKENYGASAVQAELPFTCRVTINMEGTDYGDGGDHVWVCDRVHLSQDVSAGDEVTITLTGQVLGAMSQDGVTLFSE